MQFLLWINQQRFGEKSAWIISVLFHFSLEAVAQKAFIWERNEQDPDWLVPSAPCCMYGYMQ